MSDSTAIEKQKKAIRLMVRERRRALDAAAQQEAGIALALSLAGDPLFQRARRVALFLSNDGEIDTQPLLQLALAQGKSVFLPVLDPLVSTHMHFQWYDHTTTLVSNRFGILEPAFCPEERIRPQMLNLVCMPLVAFDHEGNRLGMGGGFYDRAFAFLKRTNTYLPMLGLAHHCQQVEHVPVAEWDLPLTAIATDKTLHRFG